MNHSMHSTYLAGVPLPCPRPRHPIHFAPGAIPIWLPMPSSPIAVPAVWLPWPLSSQGNGESLPQGYRHHHEWSRASCNRDSRSVRPSRGNEASVRYASSEHRYLHCQSQYSVPCNQASTHQAHVCRRCPARLLRDARRTQARREALGR